jgi:hypothetical protein
VYNEENAQSSDPRSSLNELDVQATLIIEVPMQRLQQLQRPILEIPQVDWTEESCSQLVVEEKAELITLSQWLWDWPFW